MWPIRVRPSHPAERKQAVLLRQDRQRPNLVEDGCETARIGRPVASTNARRRALSTAVPAMLKAALESLAVVPVSAAHLADAIDLRRQVLLGIWAVREQAD